MRGVNKTGRDGGGVSNREGIEEMVGFGRDVEKMVLARGLRYHLEDRVLVHGNKTVVF